MPPLTRRHHSIYPLISCDTLFFVKLLPLEMEFCKTRLDIILPALYPFQAIFSCSSLYSPFKKKQKCRIIIIRHFENNVNIFLGNFNPKIILIKISPFRVSKKPVIVKGKNILNNLQHRALLLGAFLILTKSFFFGSLFLDNLGLF